MSGNYGGDEVSAFVLDVGADTTRIGYAGEDCPRAMFSSWLGCRGSDDSFINDLNGPSSNSRYVGGLLETVGYSPDLEAVNPYKEGQVTDWDAYEAVWEQCFDNVLRCPSTEQPLLCTESPWSTDREKIAEIAFEKFKVPALYLANTAVLSAFASGKTTGLVIDSGSSVTSVVPVYDGYALKKGIRKQNLGGDYITACIQDGLSRQYQYNLTPSYQIWSRQPVLANQPPQIQLNSNQATASFHKLKVRMAFSDFKESTCQIFETVYDQEALDSRPGKPHEFADGYNGIFGSERFIYPEVIFQPQRTFTGMSEKTTSNEEWLGLHQLAIESVNDCDVELRSQLLSNVIVTGGNTLFPGFTDRLSIELSSSAYGQRVKITPPSSNSERRFSSWLGGSILASLGTFHPLWLSCSEYLENGASILDKKFG